MTRIYSNFSEPHPEQNAVNVNKLNATKCDITVKIREIELKNTYKVIKFDQIVCFYWN